ncbi:MAG: dihydrolipoyl dehydrogenase [candidate division Zixibacteria bacterium]|nr:dihydrolipoyl dehydrogenase [candidate division Zixibacteria bacterium]
MSEKFELVIIGAGPGGYVAAIRAAQLGFKTVVVEREYLGGVCLNWGCIPSKTLLYVTELKRKIKEASRIGLKAENVSIDLDRLRKHKDTTVKRLTGGVGMLLENAGVTIVNGSASFLSQNELEIVGEDGRKTIKADNFVIATGASPIELPMLRQDGEAIIGAREAIGIPRVPEEMLVVGAGPIGVEMATVYRSLGARVTIVEMLDSVLPTLDSDIGAAQARALKKMGMKLLLSSRVTSSKRNGETVEVVIESEGDSKTHNFDLILVAAGMKPNTSSLNLEGVGVQVDSHGFVVVDDQMRSSVSHICAVGDIAGGMLLAHKASHEGIVAVEALAGSPTRADWKAVPYAVFTDPEVAGIGLTEKEAAEASMEIKVGKFPFRAIGKAVATLATDGFVKIVADAVTDNILGIHVVGPHAGDIVMTGTALMEMDATAEELGHLMAIHPTLSEALVEAGLSVNKHAIHMPN